MTTIHEHPAQQPPAQAHATTAHPSQAHPATADPTHDPATRRTAVGWALAARATLHCLIGCAIGEVLGLMVGTALGWSSGATVVLAVALAFAFGYSLTVFPLRRSGMALRAALLVALAADTVSILVMELVDNSVMLALPGAMGLGLSDLAFYLAMAASLAVAFVVTVPVNRWLMGRGLGHARLHHARH